MVVKKASRGLFDFIIRPHYLRMDKSKLSIYRAPGPKEIIWENLNIRFSCKRFTLLWGVTLIVLVVSGLINLGLT